jgi:hypothetical protein
MTEKMGAAAAFFPSPPALLRHRIIRDAGGRGGFMEQNTAYSAEELDESRRLRRLQIMMSMVMQVIAQDPKLTVEEASQMVADSRTAALAMFPGKELAYDLLYRPRFQRLMRERFRLQ